MIKINIHEFEKIQIITSIDNHLETRSVNKANTTTKAPFPRQMHKLIVGGCQVFYDFIVFSPVFNHVSVMATKSIFTSDM